MLVYTDQLEILLTLSIHFLPLENKFHFHSESNHCFIVLYRKTKAVDHGAADK